MYGAQLVAIADQQSLVTAADLLRKVGDSPMFVPPAAADAALTAPLESTATMADILTHIARRGFEPQLVRGMLDRLEEKPIARGLFAWDVLVGAIVAHHEIDLIDELCSAALKVKSWLPPAGVSCLDLDARRSRELVEGSIDREGIVPFGQLLLRARSYTFASVYLHHAATALSNERARFWACECYLEAGQGLRLPRDLLPTDAANATTDTLALTEYVQYRSSIEDGKIFDAYQQLNAVNALRGQRAESPLLRVVTNEIAIRFPTAKWAAESFDWLDTQSRSEPNWAYIARQRALAATVEGRDPLARIGEYLLQFGNDVRIWQQTWRAAGAGTPWRVASGRVLAREIATLPHEPSGWKALAIAAGDTNELAALENELRIRSVNQSTI